jgi:hypothetical protein
VAHFLGSLGLFSTGRRAFLWNCGHFSGCAAHSARFDAVFSSVGANVSKLAALVQTTQGKGAQIKTGKYNNRKLQRFMHRPSGSVLRIHVDAPN